MAQSEWISLADAFDDCVDRLRAGQSLGDCLRAYPQHAETLRGLLETARAVRQANHAVPAGARARVWARVMPAVTPRRAFFSWRVRAALAASVALVILAAVLLSQRDENPDHPLTVIPLATSTATQTVPPTTTLMLTVTPTPTTTPTATITPGLSLAVSPTAPTTLTPAPTAFATPALACLFTVQESSVNLRQGPGTGYGVAAYGFAGDHFPVVATHISGQWFQVTVNGVEVWVSLSVGVLSGDCTGLPVSTISLQDGGTGEPGTGGSESTSIPGGPADDSGGIETEVGDDGGGDSGDDSDGDDSQDDSGDDGDDGNDDSD